MLLNGDLSAEVADAMRLAGRVAIDTETSGLDWRNESLQLCQLYTEATGPVFLRNVNRAPVRLGDLLADPAVMKVFHFAPFDLRFLEAHWNVRVNSLQCTKAASKLLNPELPGPSHSLQAVLRRHLSVEVDKGSVRTSDWGATSLSPQQVAYATDDVRHLLALADVLNSKLRAAGRAEMFASVCEYIPLDAHLEVSGIPNPLVY